MGCSRYASFAICILLAVITTSPTLVTATPQAPTILEFREANYSTLHQNVTYKSSRVNDPKGMEPLYKITNKVLDFFLDDDPIADGKFNLSAHFILVRYILCEPICC